METKFKIGDLVYLVTDNMQNLYTVVAIRVEKNGVKYYISTSHFNEIMVEDFEISFDKRYV